MNNILMNKEMTKAILDGHKVQTRRVIRLSELKQDSMLKWWYRNGEDESQRPLYDGCPNVDFIRDHSKHQVNDVLWVREPARVIDFCFDHSCDNICISVKFIADANEDYIELPKRLQKFDEPPKWALNCQGIPNGCIKEMARIFLKVTNVRVERLQDITLKDILAEGVQISERYPDGLPSAWINLWSKTAQKGYQWEDNPYVFVYEFERVNKNRSNL